MSKKSTKITVKKAGANTKKKTAKKTIAKKTAVKKPVAKKQPVKAAIKVTTGEQVKEEKIVEPEMKITPISKPDKEVVLDSIAREEKKKKHLFSQEQVDKNLSTVEKEYGKTSLPKGASTSPAIKTAAGSVPEEQTIPEENAGSDIQNKSISERLKAIVQKRDMSQEKKDVSEEIYQTEADEEIKDEAISEEINKLPVSKSRSIGLYRKIAFSFIILTLILIAVVAYFSLVKVTITLIPNQERVSSNLIIDIIDQDNKEEASEGEILGVVKQVEVEQSKTYPATATEVISEEVVGKVTLINNYSKNQPLVATTRLLSPDDKLFRIRETVNIPAGGELEVEVYADEPGQDMIIGPTSFTIPGLWAAIQDKIYGESKEAMKYSSQVKKHIEQADIDKGVEDLKQSLLVKAESEIGETYQDYDQVIYDIDNNSISQEIDSEVGDEVEEFTVNAKTMVTVVAFADEEIFKLTQQKLISTIPENKELIDFSKDNIDYSLNNYNINQGTASMNINFAGKMIIKQGSNIIDKTKLAGLNERQIDIYLTGIPEIAGHEIEFYPSFIKKAPNLVDRIEIVIKQ